MMRRNIQVATLFYGLAFSGLRGQVAIKPVIGAQKIAVILADVIQDGKQQTVANVEEGLMTHANSINNFIKAASFGKTWLEPTLFGPIAYSGNLPDPSAPGCFLSGEQSVTQFENAVDFSKFERVLVLFHDVYKQCPFGISTVDRATYTTPKGTFKLSVARVRQEYGIYNNPATGTPIMLPDASKITESTTAHELLHSFGILGHSLSYLCGRETLRMDTVGCFAIDHGGNFDIMGLRNMASHPQALYKEQLGWLPAANIREVTQSGDFELFPLDLPMDRVQALKVRLPRRIPVKNVGNGIDSLDYLSIQYQSMTGFDSRLEFNRNILQADSVTKVRPDEHGAQIHGVSCRPSGFCAPYLLDMNPKSMDPWYLPHESSDALLYRERTFAVPGNEIRIRTTEIIKGVSIKVRVEFGPVGIPPERMRADAGRFLRLEHRGRSLGRIEVASELSRLVLVRPDGRRHQAVPVAGAVDLSSLPKGIYFLPQSPMRKIMVD